MSNLTIVKGHSAKDFPIDKFVEMLTKALDNPTNGILLVVTNGIDNPEAVNRECEQLVLLHRPESVAQGLFNQAVELNDFQNIHQICFHLSRIAVVTQENIDIVLSERKAQN